MQSEPSKISKKEDELFYIHKINRNSKFDKAQKLFSKATSNSRYNSQIYEEYEDIELIDYVFRNKYTSEN